ncbi:hypothetical protein BSLG_009011 [Batrachochytrium salamandrivorans]|nr:hypothetical protein BSLG_009011 [Batrachochytrium salamandrivorans]
MSILLRNNPIFPRRTSIHASMGLPPPQMQVYASPLMGSQVPLTHHHHHPSYQQQLPVVRPLAPSLSSSIVSQGQPPLHHAIGLRPGPYYAVRPFPPSRVHGGGLSQYDGSYGVTTSAAANGHQMVGSYGQVRPSFPTPSSAQHLLRHSSSQVLPPGNSALPQSQIPSNPQQQQQQQQQQTIWRPSLSKRDSIESITVSTMSASDSQLPRTLVSSASSESVLTPAVGSSAGPMLKSIMSTSSRPSMSSIHIQTTTTNGSVTSPLTTADNSNILPTQIDPSVQDPSTPGLVSSHASHLPMASAPQSSIQQPSHQHYAAPPYPLVQHIRPQYLPYPNPQYQMHPHHISQLHYSHSSASRNPVRALQSRERNDSDNISIQSDNTHVSSITAIDTIVSASEGESLETMRQNARRGKDPHAYLDFAKHLIRISEDLPRRLAHLSQKRISKNQNVLNQEAVKWLTEASKSSFGKLGLPEALFILADCYGSGSLGLAIDHDKAFYNYSQASKQNHAAATYRVAVSFEVGAGARRNADRAVEYYRRAAKLGDTAAMFKLGMIQLYGTLGQQQNPREGVTLLKRAAEQADDTTPNVLHELATLYEGNIPGITNVIIPDPAYSHELLSQSAKLGYAPSQYKLGLCHEYGNLGVPIDPRRSIAWYTKAAEQGDPDAELALSGWYLTGAEGILSQSDQEAFLWARKAADKGLAKAEYAVGYFVEHGVGVRSDIEDARKWYMRAAGQGNKRAIQRLKEFTVRTKANASASTARDFRKAVDSSDCTVM